MISSLSISIMYRQHARSLYSKIEFFLKWDGNEWKLEKSEDKILVKLTIW